MKEKTRLVPPRIQPWTRLDQDLERDPFSIRTWATRRARLLSGSATAPRVSQVRIPGRFCTAVIAVSRTTVREIPLVLTCASNRF